MPQELNEQAAATSADQEQTSQLILAHQASLDAWYQQWILAHRQYVSRLMTSRQVVAQDARI